MVDDTAVVVRSVDVPSDTGMAVADEPVIAGDSSGSRPPLPVRRSKGYRYPSQIKTAAVEAARARASDGIGKAIRAAAAEFDVPAARVQRWLDAAGGLWPEAKPATVVVRPRASVLPPGLLWCGLDDHPLTGHTDGGGFYACDGTCRRPNAIPAAPVHQLIATEILARTPALVRWQALLTGSLVSDVAIACAPRLLHRVRVGARADTILFTWRPGDPAPADASSQPGRVKRHLQNGKPGEQGVAPVPGVSAWVARDRAARHPMVRSSVR